MKLKLVFVSLAITLAQITQSNAQSVSGGDVPPVC
jgi:hypothetical protein